MNVFGTSDSTDRKYISGDILLCNSDMYHITTVLTELTRNAWDVLRMGVRRVRIKT